MTKTKATDVLVIGGGINGTGIARDLSGRGLSVILCEKDDLASATSSASTKLIHGGLRYLEQYDFKLVRESLIEREVLLHAVPYLTHPMTFVLPHHKGLRPWWLIRLGLFLYDHLGGKISLARSAGVQLAGTRYGQPLKPSFKRGFSYSDCAVDDARLVVLNALDAYEKGAQVMTRTECIGLDAQQDGGWTATLRDVLTGAETKVDARVVVNAAGPWVNKVLGHAFGEGTQKHMLRWVKGSHLIVRQLYKGDHAYILQNDDGRIVFTIPYEGKYTLIGTTDIDYDGDLDAVRISMEEVEYLCAAVSAYFRHPVSPEDVEWTYSGVRPLLGDGSGSKASSVTREYLLELEHHQGAPILNVYGGKLTTFRRLSELAADKITALLGRGRAPWTEWALMPGAEGAASNYDTFLKTLWREYAWMPEQLVHRYARSYGSRARGLLRGFKRMSDLGAHLGDDVYEAEVAYLVSSEWALTADDVLWRRSKLGLHISENTRANVEALVEKLVAGRERG